MTGKIAACAIWNGRGTRIPLRADTTFLVDYAFLLRSPDGSVRVEHDRHIQGLFPRAEWLDLLSDVGFEASVIPFEHSELDPGECELFIAKRRRK